MIGWMPHDHTGNTVSVFTMAGWIFREESNLVSQWIAMNLPLLYAKTFDNVNKDGDNDSRLNCK